MTIASPLDTVRESVDNLQAEILNTEEALAAAQRTTQIEFLRERLLQLLEKKLLLLKKETMLLQSQAPGEHCLLRYLLPPLG